MEHTTEFDIKDVLHAKDEYDRLLTMANIKAMHLKDVCIGEPMDKLAVDIHRSTLTEIIHLHRMIGTIEKIIDKYLQDNDDEGHS